MTASTPSTACSAPRATSSPTPGGNVIGGWQCQQHRSYWALRLPYNWWIWGADIQFSKYLDTSQVNYFERVAEQMGPQGQPDHLPRRARAGCWPTCRGRTTEENFFKITTIARKRGARVVAVIAGDWHNYNRYYAHELDIHFITAGGGGAFLHPTHVLRNAISVRWPERQEEEEGHVPGSTGVRPGEAWKARDVQHPPQAQHQGRRGHRRAGHPGHPGRHRAAAARRPGADAGARRSSRRRPSAIRARAAATS